MTYEIGQTRLASILDRISEFPALEALLRGWSGLADATQSAVLSLAGGDLPDHAIQTIVSIISAADQGRAS